MLTFPILKTGVTVQYPIKVSESFATEVLQFMAGDEQRYLTTPGALRGWTVQLDELDETELRAIENFFTAASGSFASFSFVDPASGTPYPNCFIADDDLREKFVGELLSGTTLAIRQGRS